MSESVAESRAMERLHLGCGLKYFYGYINIDHPPSGQTVQSKMVHVGLLSGDCGLRHSSNFV